MQDLSAVREQRRATGAEIEAARVEFHQRLNQRRRGASFRRGQPLYRSEQLIVGEIGKRQVCACHSLL
jgi:hypothetical protein